MKAQISDILSAHPPGWGFSAVALLVLLGCVTQQQAGVARPSAPLAAKMPLLEPGLIAVTTSSIPARLSFHKARGQTECVGDQAGNTAASTPTPAAMIRNTSSCTQGTLRMVMP